MPAVIRLSSGHEITVKHSFDEVVGALAENSRTAFESDRGGRVLVASAHVEAVEEEGSGLTPPLAPPQAL